MRRCFSGTSRSAGTTEKQRPPLMFLEIKNEARNGREGWKGRLQKECRETELQEAVKRMPLAPTVTENKLMYQVLAHPENTAMMQLVHFLLWANSKRQR